MKVVFATLLIEEAIQYVDARPAENLIIDQDLFSGRYHVLDPFRVANAS